MCIRESGARIREAVPEDAAAIKGILRRAFAEYEHCYTKEGYAATTPGKDGILQRMKQGPTLVAIVENKIVGTASAVHKGSGCYVRGMAVLPEARGLGIGYLLLKQIEVLAAHSGSERLYLCTTPFLLSAISLYRRFGFERSNERPHDLFGTPLFTMEKKLTCRDTYQSGPGTDQWTALKVVNGPSRVGRQRRG